MENKNNKELAEIAEEIFNLTSNKFNNTISAAHTVQL